MRRCPPAPSLDAVGEGLGGRVDPRPARHGRLGGPRRRHAVRRAGEARGAGSRARRRRWRRRPGGRWGPPDPRRADQPPRPRRHRAGSRTGWRGSPAGSCSSPTTGTCSIGSRTTCSRSTAGARTSTSAATRAGSTRAPSGRSGQRSRRRSDATWPAPSWRGCGAARQRAPASRRRGSTRPPRSVTARPEAAARSGDLPLHVETPRLGDQVVELHDVGDGYGDRLAVPAPRPGPRPARAPRDRRTQRCRASRPSSTSSPAAARRARGGWCTGPRRGSRCTTSGATRLDPDQRVREAVAGPHRQPDWTDARLLEAFWFEDDAQWAPISLLSGGERRRVQLLLDAGPEAQRAAARRAHERPRPRHPAGPGGLPRRLARRPPRRQPRPRLPRAHGHRRARARRRRDGGPPPRWLRGVGRANDDRARPAADAGPRPSPRRPIDPRHATTASSHARPSLERVARTARCARLLKEAEKDIARLDREPRRPRGPGGRGGHRPTTTRRCGGSATSCRPSRRDLAAAEEQWLSVSEELEAR